MIIGWILKLGSERLGLFLLTIDKLLDKVLSSIKTATPSGDRWEGPVSTNFAAIEGKQP